MEQLNCTHIAELSTEDLPAARKRISELERRVSELQNRLGERVEFNERILSSSSLAMAMYQADGLAVSVNEATASILGGSVEELLEQNFRDLRSWRESGMLQDADTVLATGRETRREVHFVSSFGKESWFECRMSRLTSGGEPHLLLIADDISERKRSEQARIRSEEKYRLLLETMNEGFVIVNEKRRIEYVNNRLCEMLGYSFDELVGKASSFLVYDEEQKTRLMLQARKRREGVSTPYELILKKKDGTPVQSMVSPRPVFGEDGTYKGSFSVLTDLTHMKAAERKLREARNDLEQRVEQRTSELTLMYEELAQAEFVLRQSEEKYRTIFEGSPLGIFHFDRNGVITACNQSFVQILGSSKERLVGLNMLESVQDRLVREAVREALNGGIGFYEGEYASVTADKVTPVKCHFSPLVATDGTPAGGVGIVEDVSAAKKAEFEIAESQRRYRELVENATDLVYQTDSGGRFILVNPMTLKATGYSIEEIIGRRFSDLVPPEYQQEVEKFYGMQYVRQMGATYKELPILTKSGEQLWLGQHVQVLTDGDAIVGFQGISRDITDRKVAEEALRLSEERYRELYEEAKKGEELYRSLLDSTPDAIIISDCEGNTRYVNDSFTRMFGWALDEVRGIPVEFVPDSEREMTRAIVRRVVRDGKACTNFETKRYTKDERLLDVAITASCYLDHECKPAGMLVILRDITDRKRAEELLLQSERLSAISELAGGVAHNFNNLLQIVMGEAGVALGCLKAGDTARVETLLNQIMQSSRLGSGTVKRLHDIARIRSQDRVEAGMLFDLSETARKAIEVSRSWWQFNYEKAGAKIDFHLDLQPGCLVEGQEDELFEVLLNLVKNSVEALSHGGEVRISTAIEGRQVRLKVQDTGMGIPKDHLRKVFEPFWTTKGYQATGMGLSSSLGIVKRHHGDITVASDEGRGCTFTVEVPLALGRPVAAQSATCPALDARLRILVIDDDPLVLTMLKDGLTSLGQDTTGVRTGDEALRIFRECPVDLVISDLAMPGKNGWEIGREIKLFCKSQGVRKTPFVLLTGWGGQMDEAEKIEESGVDEIVEKPIDVAHLLDVVRRLTGPSIER
ncbi:MAG: PAS domain S-box protein [Thermodesulfobacteriota bacterium]